MKQSKITLSKTTRIAILLAAVQVSAQAAMADMLPPGYQKWSAEQKADYDNQRAEAMARRMNRNNTAPFRVSPRPVTPPLPPKQPSQKDLTMPVKPADTDSSKPKAQKDDSLSPKK